MFAQKCTISTLTLRTPANVLTDRAGRRYSGAKKDIKLQNTLTGNTIRSCMF